MRSKIISIIIGLQLVGLLFVFAPVCSGVVLAEGAPSATNVSTDYNKDQVCKKMDCVIRRYVKPLIMLLSALVGIGATISIVYAGIMYSSSEGDSGKVSKAKQRIVNTIIGVIAYVLVFAMLQWFVPGGIV